MLKKALDYSVDGEKSKKHRTNMKMTGGRENYEHCANKRDAINQSKLRKEILSNAYK